MDLEKIKRSHPWLQVEPVEVPVTITTKALSLTWEVEQDQLVKEFGLVRYMKECLTMAGFLPPTPSGELPRGSTYQVTFLHSEGEAYGLQFEVVIPDGGEPSLG